MSETNEEKPSLESCIVAAQVAARVYGATADMAEMSEAPPLAVGDRKHAARFAATADYLRELAALRAQQKPQEPGLNLEMLASHVMASSRAMPCSKKPCLYCERAAEILQKLHDTLEEQEGLIPLTDGHWSRFLRRKLGLSHAD